MKKTVYILLTAFLLSAGTVFAEETYREQTAIGYPFGIDLIIRGRDRDWVWKPAKSIASEIKTLSGLQINIGSEIPERKGGVASFAFVMPFVFHGKDEKTLDIVGMKLGLLGGYFRGVDVYGLDSALFTDDGNTIIGIQLSMLAHAECVGGVQLTPIYSVAGTAGGLQASAFASYADILYGLQVSGFGGFTEKTNGFQVNGLGSIAAKDANGIQIGGLVSSAEKLCGMQISGLGNIVRGSMCGLQIGLINSAGKGTNGVQIGLFNKIEDGWLPAFPVVNFRFGPEKK